MSAPKTILALDIGGTNAKALKEVPEGCVLGANSNAFLGGYAVWEPEWASAATEL